MNGLIRSFTTAWLVLTSTSAAWAEFNQWGPPHGMIGVEVLESNNQIVATTGVGSFATREDGTKFFTHNAAGNFILFNALGGQLGDDTLLGGIANRDGNDSTQPATTESTALLTDDPGWTTSIETTVPGLDSFPVGYLLSANFLNSLQFYDGTAWTVPDSDGEQLLVADLQGDDDPADELGEAIRKDLAVTYTGTTSGPLGSINLDYRRRLSNTIHSHLAYKLTRADGDIPAVGAYMLEFTLSAEDVFGTGGPMLLDSDPMFIIFNNQLSTTDPDGNGPMLSQFQQAVAAAEQLPEPSTAMIVLALGAGLAGIRRRRHPQSI